MSSIDVIVPCYRYGQFLEECVTSVLAQPGPSIRVLVIDDASPDNTKEIATELARRDSRVTLLSHSSNRGHITTYNEGIEWASAKYLLLLSADDYLLPGALQRATRLMDAHPNVGFLFGAAIMLESETERTRTVLSLPVKKDRVLTGAQFIKRSAGKNIVFTPTAIVRTEFQKRVGGYRSDLPHCADMELWFRMAAERDVGYISTPQAVYRRHAANMSLPYMTHFLPDLLERRTVLDGFFSHHRHPDTGYLYRRARRSLGCSAVAFASASFEKGDAEACRELMRFALECSPAIIGSVPWFKFTLKRVLGLKASGALRSLLGRKTTGYS